MNRAHRCLLLIAVLLLAARPARGVSFGAGERSYVRAYFARECAPSDGTVCVSLNASTASLNTACDAACPNGSLISSHPCESCPYLVCDDGACTNEPTLCDSVQDPVVCSGRRSRCSTDGTVRLSVDGGCVCKVGFAGDRCGSCAPPPDGKVYLCCRTDSRWVRIETEPSRVDQFLSGYYTAGAACLRPNSTATGGDRLACDCSASPDATPRWLGNLLVRGPRRTEIHEQADGTDSVEGIVAFSIAVGIGSVLLACIVYAAVAYIGRLVKPGKPLFT